MKSPEEASSKGMWRKVEAVSLLLAIIGVLAVIVFAVLNRPHVAVLLLAGMLLCAAALRAVFPGKPWFGSRRRWVDVAFWGALGGLLWFLSPYTATLGL